MTQRKTDKPTVMAGKVMWNIAVVANCSRDRNSIVMLLLLRLHPAASERGRPDGAGGQSNTVSMKRYSTAVGRVSPAASNSRPEPRA